MRDFNVRIPDGLQTDTDSLLKNRLESSFYMEIAPMTVKNGELFTIMNVRFYHYKNSATTRCCVWIGDNYAGGSTSGWGYDREMQSFLDAIDKLGIEHDCHLSGMTILEELIKQIIAVIAPEIEYIYFHRSNA